MLSFSFFLYFFNREIVWQICGGIEGTGQYLITGECIEYNTDISDHAQWRLPFHEGSQTLSHISVWEADSKRWWRCREFPINPFGFSRPPNSTSHSAPGLRGHVTGVVRLDQREADAQSRWRGLLVFPSTSLTPSPAWSRVKEAVSSRES